MGKNNRKPFAPSRSRPSGDVHATSSRWGIKRAKAAEILKALAKYHAGVRVFSTDTTPLRNALAQIEGKEATNGL